MFVICVDGHAELWSLAANVQEAVFPKGTGANRASSFSKRELLYMTGGNQLVRRDLASGREQVSTSPVNRVQALQVSQAGDSLVLIGFQHVARIDLETDEVLWQNSGTFGSACAWNEHEQTVAVVDSARSTILLLNASTGALGHTLHGHTRLPRYLAFHNTQRLLFSIGDDFSMRVWDLISGSEVLQATAAPRGLKISEDGRRLAYAPAHLNCAVG
jgi:WD40 repeat protein